MEIELDMDNDVNLDLEGGKRARTFQGPAAAAGPDSEGPPSLSLSTPSHTSKKRKNWRKKCVNLDNKILRQKGVNHQNIMNFVTK